MLLATQVRALVSVLALRDVVVERCEDARNDERGSTSVEQVILIAAFATLALAVAVIITGKVMTKAKAIPTE